MLLSRPPKPSLRPFVTKLWAVDQRVGHAPTGGAREHVLPTGSMHLVFRLSGAPLRLFDSPSDEQGRVVGHSVVGGARSTFYVRDVSTPSCSVGAMLRPGAAETMFGASAEELSERHTPLAELWGASASVALDQILEQCDLERQLAMLESLLAHRLPVVRGIHPAVAYAIERFDARDRVGAVVRQSGYSHRHFIELFRTTVGLAPKAYCRVVRFHRALLRAASDRSAAWTEVALEAGYSDQSHFTREFMEFAGVSPSAYRRAAPALPNHVILRSPNLPR